MQRVDDGPSDTAGEVLEKVVEQEQSSIGVEAAAVGVDSNTSDPAGLFGWEHEAAWDTEMDSTEQIAVEVEHTSTAKESETRLQASVGVHEHIHRK